MSALTYGSVCSGIEAASCAWEPLGMQPLWFAEIEPFPCAVLAHHWPQVPNLGDMTKIAARIMAGEIPAPDVLVGGTPCQSFSVAGLGNSLEDPRGQLALAFCQLANAIDDVRRRRGAPECIVLWENVPGVLSTKDNAFGCILAGLAGESVPLEPPGGAWENAGAVFGPSRTVAWRILDAQYFGLAQRRRRVFAVASARKGFDPCAVLFESQGLRRDSAPGRDAREGVAGTLTRGLGERGAEDPERGQLIASTITGGNRKHGGYSTDDIPFVCAGVAPTIGAGGRAAGSATTQDAENGALVVYGGNNTGGN